MTGAQKVWLAMASSQERSESRPDPKFLTIAEVATMMRVSKMTVYRLVHSGELPAVRVGRSFRVPEGDVNEYLRKSFYNAGVTRMWPSVSRIVVRRARHAAARS